MNLESETSLKWWSYRQQMNQTINPITPTDSLSSFNKIILHVKNCTFLHDVGLILSQNGWRGGLDIRLLSPVRARACLYGDMSGDGGPVTGFHLLPSLSKVTCSWPLGLLHSTKTISQYLVVFSLKPLCHQAVKLTVSCSPETTFEWSDTDRCSCSPRVTQTVDGFGPHSGRTGLKRSGLLSGRLQTHSRPGGFDRTWKSSTNRVGLQFWAVSERSAYSTWAGGGVQRTQVMEPSC